MFATFYTKASGLLRLQSSVQCYTKRLQQERWMFWTLIASLLRTTVTLLKNPAVSKTSRISTSIIRIHNWNCCKCMRAIKLRSVSNCKVIGGVTNLGRHVDSNADFWPPTTCKPWALQPYPSSMAQMGGSAPEFYDPFKGTWM